MKEMKRLAIFLFVSSIGFAVLSIPPLIWLSHAVLPSFLAHGSALLLSLSDANPFASGSTLYGERYSLCVTAADSLWFLWPITAGLSASWPTRPRNRLLIGLGAAAAVIPVSILRVASNYVAGVYALPLTQMVRTFLWPLILVALLFLAWSRVFDTRSATTE